jgi:tetratricopeptide (TPR) repeat protein
VKEADDLIPIEPRNAQWKNVAAGARLTLAVTLMSAGKRDEAAQQTLAGCTLAVALPASFAAARAHLRTSCAMMRARLALAEGSPQQATAYAQQALASARFEHSEEPIADRYTTAIAYRLLGDARKQTGDAQGANAAWNAGLSQLPSSVAERPTETNERLELLERLDRTDEAAPLAEKLKGIGYHSFE